MSIAAYAAIAVGIFFALLCWGARLNEKARSESQTQTNKSSSRDEE